MTASTVTVTESLDRISWGGTSNVTVLRSTCRYNNSDVDVQTQLDHADLLVVIDAGQDEEDARPLRPALPQSAQPKQDRSLILLHNLRICK